MKLPKIVTGEQLPAGVELALAKQAKEEAELRANRRHDWLIASFGVIGGGVMGFIASLIFWLITGR